MSSGVIELALIVSVAALLGILMRMLRQPVVIAYLAAGVLIAAFHVGDFANRELFTTFSDLGIMFLLFLVGLEINYQSIRIIGKTVLAIGIGQIILSFGLGLAVGLLFGFPLLTAAYIAIALSFSSTIIVVKLLSEKKEINSLYGKISIGILLVQDFVAILLLVILTGIQAGGSVGVVSIIATALKGIGLFIAMVWLGRHVIPHLLTKVNRSQELLFVISLAWVFFVAAVLNKLGFSIEIAGFLAGVGLANSYENYQIASHFRPLRDFFILIFFAMLGSSLAAFDFSGLGWQIVVFSGVVLIGTPLIVLSLMGLSGYRRRTSFLTGVTMAQVSEFSLILASLGLKLGHIDQSIVALITAVGVVTIVISTYLILHGDAFAKKLWKHLGFFERSRLRNEDDLLGQDFKKPIILIGAQRIGHVIASHLPKDKLLIIDFDPSVIARFRAHGYTCLLGDIADHEIVETAGFETAELVICTSPVLEDNAALLAELRHLPGKRKIIVRAESDQDSAMLYRKGADYVIRPHLTSGHYIGDIVSKDLHSKALWQARERDFKYIERIVRT